MDNADCAAALKRKESARGRRDSFFSLEREKQYDRRGRCSWANPCNGGRSCISVCSRACMCVQTKVTREAKAFAHSPNCGRCAVFSLLLASDLVFRSGSLPIAENVPSITESGEFSGSRPGQAGGQLVGEMSWSFGM